jgi:hypothetical protein
MSLDINLHRKLFDANGEYVMTDCVFAYNLTHNLGEMASAAGLYEALWRPEEIDAVYAKDVIRVLKVGLKALEERQESLEKLSPENGWGTYGDLLDCTIAYLEMCEKYPEAEIRACR